MDLQLKKYALFLTSIEIWPVAIAIGASIVITRLLPIAVGVSAFFWLARWVAHGKLSRRTPVDWAIAVLVLMIPVTLWATSLPETTIPQVYRLLTGVALFYAITNWVKNTSRFHLMILGLAVASLGLVLIALIGVEWPIETKLPFVPETLYSRLPQLLSDTIHPNVMAGSLLVILPILLAIIAFDWIGLERIDHFLLAVATLAMAGILLLTKSRGAWMGFAAALGILALLRWRRGWLVLLSAALLVIVVILMIGPGQFLQVITANDAIGGIQGRAEIWSRAIYMIRDFPFTGIGMGLYKDIESVLYPFFLTASGSVPHAHNLFLQVAVDMGIPGLVAWLAISILVLVIAWQIFSRGRFLNQKWIMGIGSGLFCSQIALMIHGLTDAVTWGMVRPAPIVWALWGLSMAAWTIYVA